MEKQKNYIVTGLIMATLLIGSTYLLSKYLITTPPTEWQLYTNKESGIAFKYPPEAELHNSGSDTLFKAKDDANGYLATDVRNYSGFKDGNVGQLFYRYISEDNKITLSNNTEVYRVNSFTYPNDENYYFISDDKLFTVRLHNIDSKKFFENLLITKTESSSNLTIKNEADHKVFINTGNHYSIQIPISWGYRILNYIGKNPSDEVIVFSEPGDGPAPSIVVSASPTELTSLVDINHNNIFEKDIVIDGQKAILTHQGDSIEEFPKAKVIYVIRNSNLYTINISNLDYEKVLDGFKFLK